MTVSADHRSATTYTYPARPGGPRELHCGPRTIDALAARLDELGMSRAMVLCGPTILRHSDVVQRVEDVLGSRLAGRFGDVQPHSPLANLVAARDAARKVRPDVLVSVGGGSTIGIAKGVCLLMDTDRDPREFAVRLIPPATVIEPEAELPEPGAPLIAVPTTMGGAEFGSSGGGFADEERGGKVILSGRAATHPRAVFVDGEALLTAPEKIQRGTAMGQLRIAVESYFTIRHNPIGDGLALHAMRLLSRAVDDGWARTVDYYLEVKTAAIMASLAGVSVGTMGANTALAHHLGAVSRMPHGEANAVLLPHTVRFNAEAVPRQRLESLAEALGVARDSAPLGEAVSRRIAGLVGALGLPTRLRDTGVRESDFATIANAALGDRGLATNARPVHDLAPLLKILHAAW